MSIRIVTESQVSTPTNNFISNIMVGSRQPAPEIGMGATMCMYSDRKAGTVVAIRRFKSGLRKGQVHEIDVQEDKATRTDSNGMSECQGYAYEPNPNGSVSTFRVNKQGKLLSGTTSLALGFREKYYDYSF